MTAAAYPAAFAEANARAIEAIGFGEAYRAATGSALCVTEARYRYRADLTREEEFAIATWLAAADTKRLALCHLMSDRAGAAVAEAEILFLHVDKGGPRVVPFPPAMRDHLRTLAPIGAVRSAAA